MNKSSKAFQVPNKVITKEDITPLSRSHTKKADTRGTADGKNTTASAVEATPIIITTARSIDTAGSLSENATEDDGTQNGDLHDDDDDDDLESTLGYSSEPDPLFSHATSPPSPTAHLVTVRTMNYPWRKITTRIISTIAARAVSFYHRYSNHSFSATIARVTQIIRTSGRK